MRLLCTLLLFISITHASIAWAEMKPYNPNNTATGIESYDYDPDKRWVDIKFHNTGTIYRYPRSKFGDASIQMMIDLAAKGKGLGQFINSLPSENYRRVQELPKSINCGIEGGYPEDEWWHFTIKTRGQARAALSYAHWAPDPDGIRRCVCRYFKFPSCSKLNTGESTPKGE